MSLLIFLISTCFVAVNAVTVCQTEPKDDNDHYITSPDYPKEYPTDLDCILIIPFPQKTLLKLEIIEFVTITNLDYLNVTIGNTTTQLSGKYEQFHEFRFPEIHNVSSIIFAFHSHKSMMTGWKGFNVSYSFVPTQDLLIETKTVLDGFHGTINATYQSNFHKYEITKQINWYRFVYLHLRHCPINNTIIVNVDSQVSHWPAQNGCLETNSSYYGSNITIEIISSESETPDLLIEYKSVLKKEEENCHPHFDCGNTFCVPMSTICDGFFDCDNNMDELNCDEIPTRNDSRVERRVTMLKERMKAVKIFHIEFERKNNEIEQLNEQIILANNRTTDKEIELSKFNGSNEQLQEMRNEILKERNEVTKLLKQKIAMRKEFRIDLQKKRKEIEELNIHLKDEEILNLEDKVNNDLKIKDEKIATLTRQFTELKLQMNIKDEAIGNLKGKIALLEVALLQQDNNKKRIEKELGKCQDVLRHKNC